MLRKIKITLISLLSLILLLLLAVLIYVRSGGLDSLLQGEIILALHEVGVRAEIGSTHLDITGSKAALENLTLVTENDGKPIGVIEKIEGEFSVLSYLQRRINLTKLSITRPEIWVTVDEAGQSTFDKLKSPPEKIEDTSADNIKIFTASFELKDAIINLEDRQHNLTAIIPNLSMTFTPDGPTGVKDALNHAFVVNFDNAKVTYQGRDMQHIKLHIEGEARESSARIKSLTFNSEVASIKAAGHITGYEPFAYDFNEVQVDTTLNEVARIFAPEANLQGKATYTGAVKGEGDRYQATGQLIADN